MARIPYWPTLTVLCMAAAALPAHAQFWADKDEVKSIMADCGGPDLPAGSIDECLERACLADETNPSRQLQTLEAQLERRLDTAGDGPAPSAAGAPRSLPAPAATTAPPANTGTSAAEASPEEVQGNDPPVPNEKGASANDASSNAATPDAPPAEMSGADDDPPPPMDDGDDDNSGPPDEAPAAPHAH
ncbi:MAG: hypothetical protein ACLQUZ_15145 [Rhizomicrobium sp.]